MPYNSKTQAIQTMGKEYKAALRKLAKMQHNTQQNVVEKLIAQACQAHGFRVDDFSPKE